MILHCCSWGVLCRRRACWYICFWFSILPQATPLKPFRIFMRCHLPLSKGKQIPNIGKRRYVSLSCEYQLLKLVVIIFWVEGSLTDELLSSRGLQVRAMDHRNTNKPAREKRGCEFFQKITKLQRYAVYKDHAHTDPAGSLILWMCKFQGWRYRWLLLNPRVSPAHSWGPPGWHSPSIA